MRFTCLSVVSGLHAQSCISTSLGAEVANICCKCSCVCLGSVLPVFLPDVCKNLEAWVDRQSHVPALVYHLNVQLQHMRPQASLDSRLPAAEREQRASELLAAMRGGLEVMAKALGGDHLLVTGGARYLAQAAVFGRK